MSEKNKKKLNKPEKCWWVEKHNRNKDHTKEVLDCLTCKRLVKMIYSPVVDNQALMFLYGFRWCLFNVAFYLGKTFTAEQNDMIHALEIRIACYIDRGQPIDLPILLLKRGAGFYDDGTFSDNY